MNNEPANLAVRMREPAAAPVRQTSMALHPAAFGGCIVACLLAASACGSGSAQSAAVPVTAAPASSALPERVSIRIVPGVRPGRPADTGRGRGLVRPARRRGWRPCPGLAGGQPPWPRRDRPIWPGHTPRRPGTRPDMAGRQRQLVFLTRAARRWNGPDAVRFTRSAQSAAMSVLCYLGRATTAVAGRSARVRCRARQRVLWLVGLLVKRGDLGQAIDVLCTRAAARARAARTMSSGGTR